MMNRIHNARNPWQGEWKKVLCVCSAGLLRSPTTAFVLSQAPYNYNTRAAGIDEGHALVKVDLILLSWADEIVVVEPRMEAPLRTLLDTQVILGKEKKIVVLDIPDNFYYREPRLIEKIKEQYAPHFIPQVETSGYIEEIEE